MPIYFGCTNIDSYFPEESIIKIDINKPAEAIDIINEAINTDMWGKNIDAIEHSRSLVLEKYQFFPFVSSLISQQPHYAQKQSLQRTKKYINIAKNHGNVKKIYRSRSMLI